MLKYFLTYLRDANYHKLLLAKFNLVTKDFSKDATTVTGLS